MVVAIIAPIALRTQMNMMATAFVTEIARKMFFPVATNFFEGMWPSKPPDTPPVPDDGVYGKPETSDDRPSQEPHEDDEQEQEDEDFSEEDSQEGYQASSTTKSQNQDSASHQVMKAVLPPSMRTDNNLMSLLSASSNGSHVFFLEIPGNYKKEENEMRGHTKGLEDSNIKVLPSMQAIEERITDTVDSILHDKQIQGDFGSKGRVRQESLKEVRNSYRLPTGNDEEGESIPLMFAISSRVNDSSREHSNKSDLRDTMQGKKEDELSLESNNTESYLKETSGHIFDTRMQLKMTESFFHPSRSLQQKSQTPKDEDLTKRNEYKEGYIETEDRAEGDTNSKKTSVREKQERNHLFGFPGHIISQKIKQRSFHAQAYDVERAKMWHQVLKDHHDGQYS
jgi:hypothetical protein